MATILDSAGLLNSEHTKQEKITIPVTKQEQLEVCVCVCAWGRGEAVSIVEEAPATASEFSFFTYPRLIGLFPKIIYLVKVGTSIKDVLQLPLKSGIKILLIYENSTFDYALCFKFFLA